MSFTELKWTFEWTSCCSNDWDFIQKSVLIHSEHKILSYNDMANVVANSCLVTHPPDKEQHYHWLCNGVFTQSNKANLRLNLLWFEFLMAVYFVVYLQVSKTARLFYCTLDISWRARAPSEGVCVRVFYFRSISELSLLFFPSPHRTHHSAKPQDTSTFVTERRIFFFQQKKQIDVLPLTWLCK